MQSGPSSMAIRLKRCTYQDSHGRKIKLSAMELEREYWNRQSSYISAYTDDTLMYGRVLTIFRHVFLSSPTVFLYIAWFDDPVVDTETNLNYVLIASQNQSIIPINAMLKPLVVAFDEEEPEKLWILNC